MAGTSCLLVSSRGTSRASGTSNFLCQGDSVGDESGTSTEPQMQLTIRTAGTYSNLDLIVAVNTLSGGGATFITRKNTANGNCTVSIGAGATGEFTDLVHTDSVVATDLYCYKYSDAASSGAATVSTISQTWTPTSGTVKKFLMNAYTVVANSTSYFPIAGGNANTTESKAQIKAELAGTLSNLHLNLRSNSITATSTFRTRVAGANGNLTISVGASTAGIFEDLTHSDSVARGNLINYQFVAGATGGAAGGESTGADFTTTSEWYLVQGYCISGATTFSASTTYYFAVGGGSQNVFTSESTCNITSNLTFLASGLGVNITANTTTGATTVALRQNGSSTPLKVSIGSGLTGIFEDLAHGVTIQSTDKINTQMVVGTGTSLVLTSVAMVAVPFLPREQVLVYQAVGTAAYF